MREKQGDGVLASTYPGYHFGVVWLQLENLGHSLAKVGFTYAIVVIPSTAVLELEGGQT